MRQVTEFSAETSIGKGCASRKIPGGMKLWVCMRGWDELSRPSVLISVSTVKALSLPFTVQPQPHKDEWEGAGRGAELTGCFDPSGGGGGVGSIGQQMLPYARRCLGCPDSEYLTAVSVGLALVMGVVRVLGYWPEFHS